jgi:hypothetical protein
MQLAIFKKPKKLSNYFASFKVFTSRTCAMAEIGYLSLTTTCPLSSLVNGGPSTNDERLLLARNREHFGQAYGTPFTIEPLSQLID